MDSKELTTQINDRVTGILEAFEKRFFDIPFGNSKFQIEKFIMNEALTPARAYRSLGLTMSSRIQALREAYFNLRKEEIDIEELKENIENTTRSKYDVMRDKLELEKKLSGRAYLEKMVNDAFVEVEYFNSLIGGLVQNNGKEFTRAQFEAEEEKHFMLNLLRQAKGVTGAVGNLENMGVAPQTLNDLGYQVVPLSDKLKLLEITKKEE